MMTFAKFMLAVGLSCGATPPSLGAPFDDQRLMAKKQSFRGLTSLTTETARWIVIGDSLSDSEGRTQRRTRGLVPPGSYYWQGRFTNGPTWNEYLAAAVGLPQRSFAHAGARIGTMNNFRVLPPALKFLWAPSALDQLQVMKDEGIVLNAKDLVLVWIGNNDYLLWPRAEEVSRYLQQTETLLEGLVAQGARRLVLVGLPDVTASAFYQNGMGLGIMDAAQVRARVDQHNRGLAALAQKFRQRQGIVSMDFINIDPLVKTVTSKPQAFGLTDVKSPCFNGRIIPNLPQGLRWQSFDRASAPELAAGVTLDPATVEAMPEEPTPEEPTEELLLSLCSNPEQRLHWDMWHPSTKMHCLSAVEVLRQLAQAKKAKPFDASKAFGRCVAARTTAE